MQTLKFLPLMKWNSRGLLYAHQVYSWSLQRVPYYFFVFRLTIYDYKSLQPYSTNDIRDYVLDSWDDMLFTGDTYYGHPDAKPIYLYPVVDVLFIGKSLNFVAPAVHTFCHFYSVHNILHSGSVRFLFIFLYLFLFLFYFFLIFIHSFIFIFFFDLDLYICGSLKKPLEC